LGKQVRLFLTLEDELSILEKIAKSSELILDGMGNILTVNEASISKELSLFFSFNGAHIVKDNGYIEQIESEVIQYSRSCNWSENILEPGRIWAEFKYWNSQNELTGKSCKFIEMYNSLAKWLKKIMKISTDKGYYIGDNAYQLYKNEKYIMQDNQKYLVEF